MKLIWMACGFNKMVPHLCHTSGFTINLLYEKLGESIIQKNTTANWSPRSYDLTPLIYANKPQTLNDLKLNNERCMQ